MKSAETLYRELEKVVVGQHEAKQRISVLMTLHLTWADDPDPTQRAPNAIVVGPTGSGKTHSLKQVAALLRLPFVQVDATAFVPSGIKGLQMEEVVGRLWATSASLCREQTKSNAAPNVKRHALLRLGDNSNDEDESGNAPSDEDIGKLAEKGIVFIDEFDKLACPQRDDSNDLLQMKRDVQRRLLKMLEGGLYRVIQEGGDFAGPVRFVDTSGVLFILGGAFSGIDHPDIRKHRTPEMRRSVVNRPDTVLANDIIHYGFLPELVARAPIILQFQKHTVETLIGVLDNPVVSPLRLWQNHFKSWGVELIFDDSFKREAAERAMRIELGARGLQQVIFPTLLEKAYSLNEWKSKSGGHCTLTDLAFLEK